MDLIWVFDWFVLVDWWDCIAGGFGCYTFWVLRFTCEFVLAGLVCFWGGL